MERTFTKLLNFIKLPAYDSLEVSLLAGFLNIVCYFGILASISSLIVLPTFTDPSELSRYLASIGIIIGVALLVFTLLRIRLVRVASFILLATVWLIFAVVSAFFGSGLTDIAYITLIATTPILAGFLFGSWASILVLILNGIVGLYLAFAEESGILPVGTTYSPIARLIAYLIIFFYVPFIANLWQRYQARLFQTEKEILQTRLQNEVLEETVKARTDQLEAALEDARNLSAQLSVQLEKEHELNEMRQTIITNISHAFRTPMAIISNTAELIERYNNREEREQILPLTQRVKDQIFTINTQLRDVLIVSQLHSDGLTEISYDQMPFVSVCRFIEDHIQNELGEKWSMLVEYDRSQQAVVTLPLAIILQITDRLLSNAVKFSQTETKKEIQITLEIVESLLQVGFATEGSRIDAVDVRNLFDAFYRGKNSVNKPGLGLGLYIADQLTLQIGGVLEYSAMKDDTGNLFTLHVPIQLNL